MPPDRKDDGRAAALEALAALSSQASPCALVARINPLSTAEGQEDLRRVLPAATPLTALMLPKVESAAEVVVAAEALEAAGRACDLFVIIETPAALEHAVEIAQAHPRLKALYFGGFDLSTALG
ncbi:MAG: aldolase/citrate lyase family protein, partial [Betaproteobacteria bacterium]